MEHIPVFETNEHMPIHVRRVIAKHLKPTIHHEYVGELAGVQTLAACIEDINQQCTTMKT